MDAMEGLGVVDGIEEGEGVEKQLLARGKLFEVVVHRPIARIGSRRSTSGWASIGPALIPKTCRKSNGRRYGLRYACVEGQRDKANVYEAKKSMARLTSKPGKRTRRGV
jgi:hypothetical protein